MAKIITLVDAEAGCKRVSVVDLDNLPAACPRPSYASPGAVPVPLRHLIRQAHASGLSVHNCAVIYDLPEEWVELFVTA